MEQELPTLPEHLISPPVFSVVCVAQSLVFCVVFCRSLFVLFLLAIVLWVLLRFTGSDYLSWYLQTRLQEIGYQYTRGRRGRDPMQSVSITTNVMSSNPAHGEVYSTQHYVIKFVMEWLATGRWFSAGTPVSSTNKTDRHHITEIVLKVALSIINRPTNTLRFPVFSGQWHVCWHN